MSSVEFHLRNSVRQIFTDLYRDRLKQSRDTNDERVSIYFLGVIEATALVAVGMLGLYGTNHPSFPDYWKKEQLSVPRYALALDQGSWIKWLFWIPIWAWLKQDLASMFVDVTKMTMGELAARTSTSPPISQAQADSASLRLWAETRQEMFRALAPVLVDKGFQLDQGRIFRIVCHDMERDALNAYKSTLTEITELAMLETEAATIRFATPELRS